ncbi:MAG TPA: T9SS type A sorting domain-containing protein, partial [Chitinophagaceae bacterium]|nr:T9SS type A sorting domain-containing protein [Chitinophagaceae bacterium]
FTYGGGQFISPAGALPARPNLTSAVTFGFASNYYKNATNPKGETQIDLKLTDGDYSFAFNALNYDYLVANGSNATYKGLGKTTINGVEQSGLAFILKVIDGKTATNPDGVDKIRMKIYNKNTGAVIYDNQMGASENAETSTPVDQPKDDGTDIVVVSNPATTTNLTAQNMQMETVAPELFKFNVKVFPNPTEHQFTLVLDGASNDRVQIVVYDAVGRQVKMFEKESANIPIRFGADLKTGAYIVEVRQGDNRKTLKLVKQ